MKDVSFELYKVFYHVASLGSFSAAAARLFLSQSAISQSIKSLEEQLGVQLLWRNSRQVSLTQSGELLYSHVEQAFQLLKTGERSLLELTTLEQGELSIGASDTLCKYHLLPFLQQFHRRFPRIRLKIISRPSPVCVDLLTKGQVDVVAVNLPHAGSYPHTILHHRFPLQDAFVGGPRFRHLQARALTLQELAQLPLLTLESGTGTRRFLDHLFTSQGLQPQPEIELDSLDLLLDLAEIDLGITFASREHLSSRLKNETLFLLPVDTPIPPREWGLLAHSRLPLPPAALEFLRLFEG
ncbi:LysR family transcriptional regulator [Azotosporobacter soli]|uniref:LysR family transcriptional regulator n=1 Tax=Azotosporobacter soli TaxID=3055040 RepID=UPI0031FE8692